MKIIATLAAGALAAGAFAAVPAEAQRHGWHGDRGRHGWHGDRGWRGGPRYYRGGYGWRGGPRYHRGGYYGRPRVVCRLHRGYYGPVRRCFRAY